MTNQYVGPWPRSHVIDKVDITRTTDHILRSSVADAFELYLLCVPGLVTTALPRRDSSSPSRRNKTAISNRTVRRRHLKIKSQSEWAEADGVGRSEVSGVDISHKIINDYIV